MKFVCSLLALAFVSSVFAQNCSPSQCSAICTPSCTSSEVCTLGTMVNCGVCPSSQCLPRSSIPNTNISKSKSSSNSNSGLIGGIVGGLLGVGVVLGSLGYLFVRRRNKKRDNIPTAFHYNYKSRDTKSSENRTCRQVVSGVIPVTFVPPTNSIQSSYRTSYYSEAETPRSHIGSFATFAQNEHDDENPFDDRPISIATSFMTTTTNTDTRRDSTESVVLQQSTATVQATQVLRAKPQILRVNTVRVQDGVTRSGSLKKTIQPENTNDHDQSNIDNPFDDRYIARNSHITSNSSKESVAKSSTTTDNAADGEITIFFQ